MTRGLLVPVVVTLVATLSSLVAMGYASPPDQNWIPGVYDAADYDDVVGLITDDPTAAGLVTPEEVRPSLIAVASLVPIREGTVSSTECPCADGRAPPRPA